MEHRQGLHPKAYTHNRRPLRLVFYTDFNDVNQAISFEKQIKGWSRKKKEALMDRDWASLHGLAVCKNETSHKNYKSGFDSAQPDSDSAQPDKYSAQPDSDFAQPDNDSTRPDNDSAQPYNAPLADNNALADNNPHSDNTVQPDNDSMETDEDTTLSF